MHFVVLLGLIKIAAAGQLCMNCQNVTNPNECNFVTRCGEHEQCYMEQYLRHNIIWYDLGCQSNTICNGMTGLSGHLLGRRAANVRETDTNSFDLDFDLEDDGRILLCESCCNSATCNNGGACGVADFDYHNGHLCFECDQQLSPDNCDRVTLCDQDRFCYIHQKISDIGLFRMYQSGCSKTIQNCTQSFGNICSNCCQDNLCNNQCTIQIPQHHMTTTTTTTTTTATPGPLQIVFTDQPSQITVGSEVHLTCVISGGSSPHMTWISPTGLLPPNSHMTNEGKTLVITSFDVTNNGKYICVTSDGFQFAHHVFTVSLNSGTTTTTIPFLSSTTHAHKTTTHIAPRPPTILSTEVQPTNYHYGDDVELICRVESNPPSDQLGWNMITDPSTIPSNINLVYGTNMVKIHIQHLTAENIAQYQCFVHNSVGKDVQTFSLHPPK